MVRQISLGLSLCLMMLVIASGVAFGQTPKLSNDDRTMLIEHLNASRARLQQAVSGFSTEQLNFKPGIGKWSILECSEHLTKGEPFLLNMITGTILKTEPVPETTQHSADDKVTAMVTNRSKKFQAPDPLKPTGEWNTIEATMAEFDKRRNQTIEYVKTTDVALRSYMFGFTEDNKQDGVQWFLFLSGHADRHIAQINEIKSDPNFPKK